MATSRLFNPRTMLRGVAFCGSLTAVGVAAATLSGGPATGMSQPPLGGLAAGGLLLAGTALVLLIDESTTRWRDRLGRGLGWAVAGIGAAMLANKYAGWSAAGEFSTALPTSPLVAASLLLTGVAIVVLDFETRDERRPAQWLLLATGVAALFSLAGFLFDTDGRHGIASFTPLPLSATFAFGALSLGFLAARPDRGLANVVISPMLGGIMARRLLPLAIIVPVLLASLRLLGQRAGLYDTEIGVSLVSSVTTLVLLVGIWCTGRLLNRLDSQRQQPESALRLARRELELGVHERTADLARTEATLQDEIAERQLAENELRRRDRQLQQARQLETVGVLAGGLANEFSGLLETVCNHTQNALQSLAAGDPRRDDLQQTLCAAERGSELARQLQGFRKTGTQRRNPFSVNTAIVDALETIRPTRSENIDVELALADHLPDISADPQQFAQLLAHLCENAREAMPLGGELLLKTETVVRGESYCWDHPELRPGEYLLLTVSDTGCGMTAETRDHVFEPFFTTRHDNAPGLGLPLVYGIARQHEGAVHIYSEPGQGCTVKVYFPIAADLPTSTAMEEEIDLNRSPGGATILIAEDQPRLRAMEIQTLHEAGYRTIAACTGVEAVRLLADHADHVDLVLLDAMMPEMGGREALDRMQVFKPNVRAIFCSGYPLEAPQIESIAETGLPFLQKPFDAETLLRSVRKALRAERPCSEATR